jgi:5'-nucleotidase
MKSSRQKLTVAISSRALFNLDESHAVFENEGVEAYCRYQVEREEILFALGVAFANPRANISHLLNLLCKKVLTS